MAKRVMVPVEPKKVSISYKFFSPQAWFRMLVSGLFLYFLVLPETGKYTALFLMIVVVGMEAHLALTNELVLTAKKMKTTLLKVGGGTTASRIRSLRIPGRVESRKWK